MGFEGDNIDKRLSLQVAAASEGCFQDLWKTIEAEQKGRKQVGEGGRWVIFRIILCLYK